MSDKRQFVNLRDISGVRFDCGCGDSIQIPIENLTGESIGKFFAYHTHADAASFGTVNEDKAFLNGRLSKFFTEDLEQVAAIAARRKMKFSFEIRERERKG